VQHILKIIQADGLLTRSWKGFEPRLAQQQMMANIIDAYAHNHVALIEAGTGTGKSLAYLIPALMWAHTHRERTVISTNTITLQEQLLQKDIPALISTLNLDIKATLVRGMGNYLCLRKLNDLQMELPLFAGEEVVQIQKIEQWQANAVEGVRTEMPFGVPTTVWDKVCAENETCSYHECPFYQSCYFFKARRQAQDAHLLVVNHHLLFCDLEKRAESNNYSETCILPAYRRVILDEAHHIEDIATEYFANRVQRLELISLLSKLAAEKQSGSPGKLSLLKDRLQKLQQYNQKLELATILHSLNADLPIMRHQLNDCIHQTFDQIIYFLEDLKSSTKPSSEKLSTEQTSISDNKLRLLQHHNNHPHWSKEINPRIENLVEFLRKYCQILVNLELDLKAIDFDRLQENTKSIRLDIQALVSRLELNVSLLRKFLTSWQDLTKVRWIETQPLKSLINVHLVDATLDVSQVLVDFMFSKIDTVVLCSATLTSNRQFNFVRDRLGLTKDLLPDQIISENIYDSPFDYQKQVLLAVPTDMPMPSHPDFNKAAYECIWKAVEASQGQVFVLFTSYNMLKGCVEVLAKRLQEQGYPLFKQGEGNRQTLLHQFKTTNRAVLFGTDSFWEGVDVAGEALRCVVIVKLPFKVPSEPMIQARTESIVQKGGDAFMDYSIPQAIVKFKQGFGRLIRQRHDRGCIVCLDTRLVNKHYGKLFIDSLPACEKAYLRQAQLWSKMVEFYKKTYYLTKKNT